jgi:uncharacterized membrane protein YgcG
MKLTSPIRRNPAQRNEHGYIMLTLLLAMALMVIFAGVIVPSITFEIKRDREEEMIHRGVQYSRAIRAYYKKFGRYPTKIEDLESSNNMRFLRKRYKDPLNCKSGKCADFKLLHFGEVQMSMSGIGGGTIPGANAIGASAGGLNGGPGGLSQPSTFGANPSFGASPNSQFGQNQPAAGTTPTGTDASQPGSPTSSDATGNPSGPGSSSPGSNQLGSGQIIGGPIVGVASNSPIKDSTYREFNHKKKYKDWVFVYDPAQDQGRLITTPYQPQLQGFGQQPNLNGQNGSNGQPGGFGSSSGSGSSSSGFGNSPSSPSNGGLGQPNPPSNPPQQQ